jgi:phosphoribosylanthranilate isomerase
MTRIKICGMTNKMDAINAAGLGVDMLGFVCYKKSKRYVPPKVIMDIAGELPPYIAKVGVFVDEEKDKVFEIAEECSLDILQLHGHEENSYCELFKGQYKIIKAFRIKDKKSLEGINDYNVDYFLLDNYSSDEAGGTGKCFDRKIIEGFEFLKPVILSGGLTPDNVKEAIERIVPYGVDVSSGVESLPGKKEMELMKKFVTNARKALT